MWATSGHNSQTRGHSSIGTMVWSCTNLETLTEALTRGATLSSSPFAFAIRITNITIFSGVVPPGMPKSVASWKILLCQRCGAPCGLNTTVSSICWYVHPSGVYFAVMAEKVSKRTLKSSLLGEKDLLSGVVLIHLDWGQHKAR